MLLARAGSCGTLRAPVPRAKRPPENIDAAPIELDAAPEPDMCAIVAEVPQDVPAQAGQSEEELYDIDNLVTADVNATCGSIGGAEGVMNVKLAWMDMTDFDAAEFYTEERLIFTPASASSTGAASCALVEVGLVGMHIAHKTTSQQNWVWSTFEHNANAPDCGEFTEQGVNTACPSTDASGWNFYPADCQADGEMGMCQSCNTVPAGNVTGSTCDNDFCVDQPPAAESGYSRLCRQVPVTEDGAYRDAYHWNQLCQAALGSSVWANYMLISTQWFDWSADGAPTQPAMCSDVAEMMDSIPQGATAGMMRAFYRP